MSIRFGGSWFVRWPVRSFVLLGIVLAGFLPYKFEVGGHCRIVAQSEVGLRCQLQDEIGHIYAADGQQVEENGLVATLVGRDVDAQLVQAKSEVIYCEAYLKLAKEGFRDEDVAAAADKVVSLESSLTFAEADLKRQKDLLGRSAAAPNEYDRALSVRDSAKASLAAGQEVYNKLKAGYRQEGIDEAEAKLAKAKADLDLAEKKSALKEIRSPIRGTLSTPSIELHEHQAVVAGDLIAVVQDRSTLNVEILADEAAAAEVRKGMDVKIRLWGNYGDLLSGKVERVAISAISEAESAAEPFRTDKESTRAQQRYPDDHWRYVRIIAKLEEPNDKLLPGMTGEARIVISDDCFWGTLVRDINRLIFVEVWSWLP
ncbi:MAG TPA: HlyD family efflux transporter periplasmic adaptor subunit [Pirellulales bacterium]|jgi:multidrug resistance efflux pump